MENLYLDLMAHIHTSKGTLDILQKKLDLWKDTQLQNMVTYNEKRQHYLNTIEVPRREFEKEYDLFLKTLQHQRELFMKSTPIKRQALLDVWLNTYNEGVQNLQVFEKSIIYTAKS
uniref:Uncharacterized protein n=1 Tax=viral metagenome TaxID=1070528 RepID=A0A6C0CSR8_9ZZZZ